jgi:hypothetical protein
VLTCSPELGITNSRSRQSEQAVYISHGLDHRNHRSPGSKLGMIPPLMWRDRTSAGALALDEENARARENHQPVEASAFADDLDLLARSAQCNDAANQMARHRTL